MLFVLCLFAPLRLSLIGVIDFDKLLANITVRFWGLRFFEERIRLTGDGVQCNGSINTQINYSGLDFTGGVGLAKCVTVDSVYCRLTMNVAGRSPFLLQVGNASCFVAAFCGVTLTHTKIATEFSVNFDKNNLTCAAYVSFNIFEVLCFTTQQLILGGNNGRSANK